MLSVPPVLSRVIPIIAPSIIRNPIDAIVLPKPSFIVLIMVFVGRVVNARKSETRKRAMNAVNFNLEVSRIIAIMLINTSTEVSNIFIKNYLLENIEIEHNTDTESKYSLTQLNNYNSYIN